MKRCRHPWIFSAVILFLSCLILLAPAMEIPAMGQASSNTATPSQASPAETEGAEIETTNGEALTEKNNRPGENQISLPAQLRAASGSNATPIEVVKVLSVLSDTVIEAEKGHAKDTIIQMFHTNPIYGNAVLKLSDGTRKIVPIQYDYDSLDTAQTGLTLLSGTITPPAGVYISPELDGVEFPVFLYDPAAPCEMPASFLEPLSCTQIILPEYAAAGDLIKRNELDDTLYYELEGGFTWNTAVSWDFDEVSFGTPGIYKAIARPKLPEGILLPDKLPELVCNIVIQEDGPLLLGPPEFTGLYMTAEWTRETPDPDQFRCFYAIGDGEWQEDIEQELISIPRFAPHYLQVFYYEDVFFETPYSFQISYEGEYSNILKVYFSEGQIHYNFYDGDRDGGDREDQTPPDVNQTVPPSESSEPETTLPPESTGPEETSQVETLPADTTPAEPPFSVGSQGTSGGRGNASGRRNFSGNSYVASGPGYQMQAPPSLPAGSAKEVPAAAPISETAASATEYGRGGSSSEKETAIQNPGTAAVVEEDTADYVVLSGKRLKKYMELHPGQPFLITKHRIQLEIPVEDSIFSGLEDQSLFRAELLSLPDDAILVSLSIDGVPVPSEDMPELTITMPRPVPEEDVPLQVTGPDGAVLAMAQAVDRSRITFTLNQDGTFRIQAVPSQVSLPEGQPVPEPLSEASPAPVAAPETPDSPGKDRPAPLLTALAVLAVLLILSGLFCLRRFHSRPDRTDKKGGGTT